MKQFHDDWMLKTRMNHFQYILSAQNRRTSELEEAELDPYDLFELCINCTKAKMSSVPMASYAAMKTCQNRALVARSEPIEENQQYFKKYCMEPTPMKYSSKLMNSIWGMYNRYSVHNFKKNIDANVSAVVAEGHLI